MPNYLNEIPLEIATLNGIMLPTQFSYEPIVPERRFSVDKTAGGTVILEAPNTVPSDLLIPWTMIGSKGEFNLLFQLYNVFPAPNYNFVGYWGDVCVVKFHVFDKPKVQNRIYEMSGSFRVISVTTYTNLTMIE